MMTKRLFIWASWAALGMLIFVTVSPIGLRPHTFSTVSLDRAMAFACAGALFSIAYPRRWLSLAVFLVAAAYGIEMLQWLSPSRHPQFNDATVKACGALAGIIAGKTALAVRRRYRRATAARSF